MLIVVLRISSSSFSLEQITEDHRYDPRDIQRFNELDAYTLMFIQHGQLGSSFDQDRALSVFDGSMSWRKRHDVHGIRRFAIEKKRLTKVLFGRYFCQCISSGVFRSTCDLFPESR